MRFLDLQTPAALICGASSLLHRTHNWTVVLGRAGSAEEEAFAYCSYCMVWLDAGRMEEFARMANESCSRCVVCGVEGELEQLFPRVSHPRGEPPAVRAIGYCRLHMPAVRAYASTASGEGANVISKGQERRDGVTDYTVGYRYADET